MTFSKSWGSSDFALCCRCVFSSGAPHAVFTQCRTRNKTSNSVVSACEGRNSLESISDSTQFGIRNIIVTQFHDLTDKHDDQSDPDAKFVHDHVWSCHICSPHFVWTRPFITPCMSHLDMFIVKVLLAFQHLARVWSWER